MFLRLLRIYCGPGTGIIYSSLYRCDACGREYMPNSPNYWMAPYSDEYCHDCFVKVPGAVPNATALYLSASAGTVTDDAPPPPGR